MAENLTQISPTLQSFRQERAQATSPKERLRLSLDRLGLKRDAGGNIIKEALPGGPQPFAKKDEVDPSEVANTFQGPEVAPEEVSKFMQVPITEAALAEGETTEAAPVTEEEAPRAPLGKRIEEGVAAGAIKLTQEAGNTLLDAGAGAINLADDMENWLASKGIGSGEILKQIDGGKFNFADVIPEEVENDPISKTASIVTQYMLPFGAVGVLVKGSKLARFTKASLGAAALSASIIDPEEDNLSNMVQSNIPLLAPIAGVLAHEPGDSRMEGRFKNAMESILFDAALGGIFYGGVKGLQAFRGLRAQKKGIQVAKGTAPPSPKEMSGVSQPVEATKDIDAAFKAQTGKAVDITPEELTKVKSVKDLSKAANVNMTKFETSAKAKTIISNFTEKFAPQIDEARRGVVPISDTKRAASRILGDEGEINKLLSRNKGEIYNDAEMTAARAILASAAEQIEDSARAAIGGTSAQKAILHEQLGFFRQMLDNVAGSAAEAGRVQRSMREMVAGGNADIKARMLSESLNLMGGEDSIEELAKMVIKTADDKATFADNLAKIARKSKLETFEKGAYKVMMNWLLSGPKTHVVNIISGTTAIGTELVTKTIAAALPGRSITFREVGAEAVGLMNGLGEAFSLLGQIKREGIPTGITTKFNIPTLPKVTAEEWDQMNNLGKVVHFMSKTFVEPFGKALVVEDLFFRTVAYRMRVQGMATRIAVNSSDNPAEFAKIYKRLLNDPPDEIQLQANKLAQEVTFTKPLQTISYDNQGKRVMVANVFGGNILGPATESIDNLPFGRVIAPFMKVNVNLIDYQLKRTPGFSMLSSEYRRDMKGLNGGPAKEMAIARTLFGGMLMSIGGALNYNGQLTGAGPKNFQTRKALQTGRADWQPNSLKIGDKFVSLDRLDPFASIMLMGADIADFVGYLSDPEVKDKGDVQSLILTAGALIADNFTPEFLMDNMVNFLSLVNQPTRGKEIERTIQNFGTRVVPLNALLRGIRQETDPVRRSTFGDPNSIIPIWDSIKNAWMNTIPGYSESLPPQRNIFGEVVHYTPGLGPDIASPFHAMNPQSPLSKELMRLGNHGPLINPEVPDGEEHLKITLPPRTIRIQAGL